MPDHFEALFRESADPWGTRSRWYEQRKRALTLAMLPAARYERAFEPGCGAGELTAELARRCDEVVATDASAAAVGHARRRLAGLGNVRVAEGRVPDAWPARDFDLVVLSELGYYLAPDALTQVARRCRMSLRAGGTLLACHWRRAAPDMVQSAERVHAVMGEALAGRLVAHYEDADILLDAWSDDVRSPAQREGLA